MSIIVQDTFTEASVDKNLDAAGHVPDVGTSWVQEEVGAAGRDLEANFATDDCGPTASATTDLTCSTSRPQPAGPTPANYDVRVKYVTQHVSNDDAVGLVARHQGGTGDVYSMAWYPSGANPDRKILKRVTSVWTLLASGNLAAPAAGAIMKFEIRAATKKCFQGVTQELSTADDAITGTGNPGLFAGAMTDVTTDDITATDIFDDYDVDDLAVPEGGGGGPPAGSLQLMGSGI